MQPTVRLAAADDAPALQRLNTAFNGDTGVSIAQIHAALSCADEVVAVAESEGGVVAFCCAQIHRSFCYPAPVAEITEMYVDESFRHRGCARALLRFVEAHLSCHYGVDECHLLTGCTNHAAQAAYAAAGYRVHQKIYMVRKLPPVP